MSQKLSSFPPKQNTHHCGAIPQGSFGHACNPDHPRRTWQKQDDPNFRRHVSINKPPLINQHFGIWGPKFREAERRKIGRKKKRTRFTCGQDRSHVVSNLLPLGPKPIAPIAIRKVCATHDFSKPKRLALPHPSCNDQGGSASIWKQTPYSNSTYVYLIYINIYSVYMCIYIYIHVYQEWSTYLSLPLYTH